MNSEDLFYKMAAVGKEALLETIRMIDKGEVTEEIQDESGVTFAAKITKEDELLTCDQLPISSTAGSKGSTPMPILPFPSAGSLYKLFCLDSQEVDIPLQKGEIYLNKA